MQNAREANPYWSEALSTLFAALGSSPAGLGSERAAAQRAVSGPNAIEDATRLGALQLLLRQFRGCRRSTTSSHWLM